MASLPSTKLAQVAFVVKEIEPAMARWSALLGHPIPNIIVTDPGDQVNQIYRGNPSFGQCKLAFFDLGGVQLELIEPIGTDTAWYEGLDRNGERFHHLAFWTEDMDAATAALSEHGVDAVHRGDMGEGQYVYFDGDVPFGTFFEFLQHKR